MATEAQRAPEVVRERTITPPRVQPGRGSLANAAERSIFEHKTAGIRPFYDYDGSDAGEEARNILAEASCLTNILATAFADAKTIGDFKQAPSEFEHLPQGVHEQALNGLNRLIQLADFYVQRGLDFRS